jgi:predicted GIY-YIG superfamily endonuclease
MINICGFDLSELKEDTEYVYVLRCEDNKYYVGYTKQIHKRMSQHFYGKGSVWTKKYKPLEIIDIAEGNLEDEEATTYVIMLRHGWQNVRGSTWCQVNLKEPPLYIWSREIIETL